MDMFYVKTYLRKKTLKGRTTPTENMIKAILATDLPCNKMRSLLFLLLSTLLAAKVWGRRRYICAHPQLIFFTAYARQQSSETQTCDPFVK